MSIQANELRIGNYLYDDDSDDIMVVSMIESKEYAKFNNDNAFSNITAFKIAINDGYYEGDFRPIPLTEELLLKFGFVKYQWMNGYFINTIFGDLMIQFYKTEIHLFFTKVSYDSQGMTFYGRKFINNKTSFTDCKYVHQLQNLYFALTGEELTIKL
jgi:hypothetical protein